MTARDDDGVMSMDAREFALRLDGYARTGLRVFESVDVVNAFLAVTVGVALTLMPRENVAGWLRLCAEAVEHGDDPPAAKKAH